MKKVIIVISLLVLSSLSLAKTYFSSPNKNSGQLILDASKSTTLSPVVLQTINGEEIRPRGSSVWLKPGEYTLRFGATITNNAPNVKSGHFRKVRSKNQSKHTLQLTVVENKTYYIAYDHESKEARDWQPVVWKVE